MRPERINLRVLLPTHVLVDEPAAKLTAEAQNGSFCLLPKHVDFVAALVPGILSFETPAGVEQFVALDEGILVKCGAEVSISTRNAVRDDDLGSLRGAALAQFRSLEDREKLTRAALAKLETSIVRRFMELGGRHRE